LCVHALCARNVWTPLAGGLRRNRGMRAARYSACCLSGDFLRARCVWRCYLRFGIAVVGPRPKTHNHEPKGITRSPPIAPPYSCSWSPPQSGDHTKPAEAAARIDASVRRNDDNDQVDANARASLKFSSLSVFVQARAYRALPTPSCCVGLAPQWCLVAFQLEVAS
jgi:hypothetical protein